jgi:hypothetical protein
MGCRGPFTSQGETMKTIAVIATNSNTAYMLVHHLVGKSRWFEFTPLPNDNYEIAVKDEDPIPAVFLDFPRVYRKVDATARESA